MESRAAEEWRVGGGRGSCLQQKQINFLSKILKEVDISSRRQEEKSKKKQEALDKKKKTQSKLKTIAASLPKIT